MSKLQPWKITLTVALLIVAILSITVFGERVSSPDFYPETLRTLEDQKQDAMTLSIVVTAASTALSTLPDDMGSPVAEELADLASPLFLIVCILYMEKFLLTTLSWFSFSFLVPGTCLFAIIYLFCGKERFFVWAKKLLILSAALILIIPLSAQVTLLIENTFADSVSETYEKAYQLAEETGSSDKEGGNAFIAFFSELKDNVVSLVDAAKNMLSVMVDAVAVLLITSCVIPVLTALLFLWVVKMVINVDIPVKNLALLVRPTKKKLPKADKPRIAQE